MQGTIKITKAEAAGTAAGTAAERQTARKNDKTDKRLIIKSCALFTDYRSK